MSDRCALCSSISPKKNAEHWNRPLFETRNYVVLPSLGALVEGWLLIVPREHFICAGAMPHTLIVELHQLKNMLCQLLKPVFGEIVAFEHGPSRILCDIGCGVDHAHLHLVPFSNDLQTAVDGFSPENTEWISAGPSECVNAFLNDQDYLYFEQPLGFGRIARGSEFKSQIFRKAIASSVGCLAEFNWRENPQLELVLSTIERLKDMTEVANDEWLTKNLKAA